jgi:hypothetical protein
MFDEQGFTRQKFILAPENELVFQNFQNMYFWVSIFFAKQYTVRYLCEERTLEILLQNTMYFVRYKKANS